MMGKFKAVGRWGAIACATITAGICITAIPFNLNAERQEEEIWIKIDQLSTTLAAKTVNPEISTSAHKLQHFTYSLGFDGLHPESADSESSIISPESRQNFQQIQTPLQQYLDAVVMNPQGEVAPPPPQLQEYWQKNADTIAEMRNLLRFYKPPHYSSSVAWMRDGGATSMPDSLRGLQDVQNILLLDAIAQYRQGKVNLAQDSLEATYNLAISGENLVAPQEQADYLELIRQQALFMRKLDNLPVSFGQRLAKDYHPAIENSLQAKITSDFAATTQARPAQWWRMDEATGTTHNQDYPIISHSGIFGILYLRHAAIASYQANMEYLQQLSTHEGCNVETIPVASAEEWWNWDNQQHPVDVAQLWQKATQLEQEIELTQLILQAKAISANTGQFPASLANLASTACPGATWQYKLNRDGTASIQGVGNATITLEKL